MSIGIGFVGAGSHARHHMGEFARLPSTRLAGVYDIDAMRTAQAAQDFPPLIRYASLGTLLADPQVDAVVIATPAETHRTLVAAALAHGRHVLREKPMAHTANEAAAIADLAAAHPDCLLLVGHCERFNRAYVDAAKASADGHIGTPRFAWATRISPLHLNYPAWQLGALDTAVHDIDLLLWLVDDTPAEIAAQGVTASPALAVADHVTYQIRFAHGALAQGHVGWVPMTGGYPMRHNAHPQPFVAGSEGMLHVDLWQRPVAVHNSRCGDYFWPDDVLVGYGDYFTEVTSQAFAFLQAIKQGKPLPITPAAAYQAVRVTHAAHVSLTQRGGLPVKLEATPMPTSHVPRDH